MNNLSRQISIILISLLSLILIDELRLLGW